MIMAKLTQKSIHQMALQILDAHPQGIRRSELQRALEEKSPDTPPNSIHGGIHQLLIIKSTEITKIARGTYRLQKYVVEEDSIDAAQEQVVTPVQAKQGVVERDFYDSFAEWLKDNDEATTAFALGGASLGGKWGTPDVIGVLKPRAQDIFKFEQQIITAEIKSVPNQPVVAFGQAVAYRLFSHKSYIVIPRTTSEDDMNRLKSLCSIHGVGLVTFDLIKEHPDYSVVVLPVNAVPDMFYVNNMLEKLKSTEPKILNALF